jgi:glycosyltransferase involved in cell wall biosynthesis
MVSAPRIQLVNKSTSPRTGIGRYAHELERGLRDRGINLRLAPLRSPALPIVSFGRRLGYDPEAFFRSYPLRADVLPGYTTHLTTQTLGVLLLLQRLPRPVIVTVHDILPYLFRHDPELRIYRHSADRLMDLLAMRGLTRADHLIADSHFTKFTIVNALGLSPERVDVTYLGVDTTRFQPAIVPDAFRARSNLPVDHRYVLYVGSEDPRKNLPVLLRAVALARRDLPDLILLKVGASAFTDQRARHVQLCWDLGITSAVRWIEEVPEADLPLFYNVADVFVFPSRYEGFGFPVLEALACGTPVVASHAGSIPELAGDAATLLGNPQPENLAREITRLIAGQRPDRDALMQQAARFRWDSTVQTTIRIVQSVGAARQGYPVARRASAEAEAHDENGVAP